MAAIETGDIGALSTVSLRSLTTDGIVALGTDQIAQLGTLQVAALTTDQIRAIQTEDVAALGTPIQESIIVDAAWNSVQKDMEYQGILYKTNTRIFHMGPLANGTNNIGEFLAIVHALAYCKKHGMFSIPIYSDSRNAIGWVKAKKCKTNLEESAKTKHIFELIHRAEAWLNEYSYKNKILKWETEAWGENPADFGRK